MGRVLPQDEYIKGRVLPQDEYTCIKGRVLPQDITCTHCFMMDLRLHTIIENIILYIYSLLTLTLHNICKTQSIATMQNLGKLQYNSASIQTLSATVTLYLQIWENVVNTKEKKQGNPPRDCRKMWKFEVLSWDLCSAACVCLWKTNNLQAFYIYIHSMHTVKTYISSDGEGNNKSIHSCWHLFSCEILLPA